MSSLFTDAEKAEFGSLLVDVAETWERDIVVFKSPEKLIVYSDVNYDRFSANDQNNLNNPTNEFQKFTIKARIYYEDKPKDEFFQPNKGSDNAQIKLAYPNTIVRIKVNQAGYEIMKEAREIEFDNFRYFAPSPERLHGLFNTQYYTFYLLLIK